MKRFRVSAVVVATLGAVLPLAGLAHPTDPARIAPAGSRFLPTPPFGPPREIVLYVHAKSLARHAGHWELRVDPAQFLSGLTAQRAAVEDGVIGPGEAVPNDFYTQIGRAHV